MFRNVFVDTWGWVTMCNRREPFHQQVCSLYQELRLEGAKVYTTDYILDETFTIIFRRVPFFIARKSVDIVTNAVDLGLLILERISPERFEKAKVLRLRYRDKPKISFTDLTTMTVMEELGIKYILSQDAHFEQVGLGFSLLP